VWNEVDGGAKKIMYAVEVAVRHALDIDYIQSYASSILYFVPALYLARYRLRRHHIAGGIAESKEPRTTSDTTFKPTTQRRAWLL